MVPRKELSSEVKDSPVAATQTVTLSIHRYERRPDIAVTNSVLALASFPPVTSGPVELYDLDQAKRLKDIPCDQHRILVPFPCGSQFAVVTKDAIQLHTKADCFQTVPLFTLEEMKAHDPNKPPKLISANISDNGIYLVSLVSTGNGKTSVFFLNLRDQSIQHAPIDLELRHGLVDNSGHVLLARSGSSVESDVNYNGLYLLQLDPVNKTWALKPYRVKGKAFNPAKRSSPQPWSESLDDITTIVSFTPAFCITEHSANQDVNKLALWANDLDRPQLTAAHHWRQAQGSPIKADSCIANAFRLHGSQMLGPDTVIFYGSGCHYRMTTVAGRSLETNDFTDFAPPCEFSPIPFPDHRVGFVSSSWGENQMTIQTYKHLQEKQQEEEHHPSPPEVVQAFAHTHLNPVLQSVLPPRGVQLIVGSYYCSSRFFTPSPVPCKEGYARTLLPPASASTPPPASAPASGKGSP